MYATVSLFCKEIDGLFSSSENDIPIKGYLFDKV